MNGRVGITLTGLQKSYGALRVLRDFSLSVAEGQCLALMGPSGCGKTTLLRILMGLERCDGGTIAGLTGRRVSVVFQEDRLCENFSALSNVAIVCGEYASRQQIGQHLADVGLQESADRPVRELSGGMRRRVAIVRAVLAPRELLLLDEPFTGLDEDNRVHVAEYIKRHTQGVTTLLVTHDIVASELMGARVVQLAEIGNDRGDHGTGR